YAVRDQLLASRYGRDTVALTLAATIARTYFTARSLDSQLTASEEILRAADESVSLATKRANAGVASELDVYQAGSLRTAAATQRIGVAKAARFPTLSLTGSLGEQSAQLSSLFDAGSRVWSIGAGLVGPIIDGGRYQARTEQAEAQARQAQAAYQKAVETAFR